MLEAAGAWPPISESHVEMDGAWALYEAWVRLQHGDVDVALVFASGRAESERVAARDARRSSSTRTTSCRSAPTTCRCPRSRPQAVLDRDRTHRDGSRRDRRAVAPRREAATRTPAVSGDFTVDDLLAKDYVVAPLREHDIGPPVDGAAAVVLVAGDRARELCDRPAWIAGIDHRVDPHYPGVRDLATSPSTDARGRARPACRTAASRSRS